MGEKEQLEQNKQEHQFTSNGRTAIIGLVGGVFWSLIGYLTYILNFTKYGPSLILQPWDLGTWKMGTSGQIWGIVAIGIVSILIAFIYKAALGRVKNMWISVGFGLALWVVVFYIIQPFIPGLEPVNELGKNTISTTLSLYTLYGLFVGYSISFDLFTAEYNERQDSQEKQSEA